MRMLRRPTAAFALAAAALALPAVASAKLPSYADHTFVPGVGIGGVKLGQTHAQAKRAWGSGGACTDFYCTYQDARRPALGSATFGFEDGKRGRVSNITIYVGTDARGKPVFRTPLAAAKGVNGVGLGSSRRAVKAAYPKAKAIRGVTNELSLVDRRRNETLFFFTSNRLVRILLRDDRPRG